VKTLLSHALSSFFNFYQCGGQACKVNETTMLLVTLTNIH